MLHVYGFKDVFLVSLRLSLSLAFFRFFFALVAVWLSHDSMDGWEFWRDKISVRFRLAEGEYFRLDECVWFGTARFPATPLTVFNHRVNDAVRARFIFFFLSFVFPASKVGGWKTIFLCGIYSYFIFRRRRRVCQKTWQRMPCGR